MLRSATFTIGILLAGLAFLGYLFLGGLMAPPPYSVVVAVQDIPAYSVLNGGALGVDAQRINSQVARTLLLREEIDDYIGGFVIENIHAGEPLRKSAVVATGNPQAINRLSLVMTDPDKVAIVLPVDAKTAPSQIAPGDWVDLVVGLAPGNISAGNSSTFANLLTPPTAVSPVISFVPTAPASAKSTPPPLPMSVWGNSPANPGIIAVGDMNLPADKVVIQAVPILAVRFQQVPNPAFTGSGSSLGQSPSSQAAMQSAYIQGDIQSVTALVPRQSVELITFGLDNGRLHLVLLPAQTGEAANGVQTPTFGITFNDMLAWMMRERLLSSTAQTPAVAAPATPIPPTQSSAVTVPGILPGTPSPNAQPSATVTVQPTRISNQPKATPTPPATIPTGLDLGALLVPLTCGIVLLVIFVAVVRFIRQRRRYGGQS